MQVKCQKVNLSSIEDKVSAPVACTSSPTCPVAMTELYYATVSLKQTSPAFAFRGIPTKKSREQLRRSGKISYTMVWEVMLSKIDSLGYNTSKFGIHTCSFHAGGATAVTNVGIKDKLFKRHWRWHSKQQRMAMRGT